MATTVAFHTLGCKLNFSETSTLARQFRAAGFAPVALEAGADVVVVNTCSVTENADRKCRQVVKQALKRNPQSFVAIVGCYAQLKPQEIAAIPGVDAVFGAAEKFRLLELLPDFAKRSTATVHHGPVQELYHFEASHSFEGRSRAFLKVQDGCDYKCSFCTIPLARGQSRSAAPEAVLAEAHALAADGVQEIVLTGINLGDYRHENTRLLHLLQLLDRAPTPLPRLRLSSVEPNLLSDEIIDFIAASERFVPHFHVPLQSGSDEILAGMRRRYRRDLYADRIQRVRAQMPDAAIGADVIVGFPGETDAHFEATRRFLAELDVTYLHVFPYSERSNTLAPALPGAVPEHRRKQRSEILRALSACKQRAFAQRFVGKTRPVLFEQTPRGEFLQGLTDNYLKVLVPSQPNLGGKIQALTLSAEHLQN